MSERTKYVFSLVAEFVGLDQETLLPAFEGEEYFTLCLSENATQNELLIQVLFVPIDFHGEGWGRKILAALELAARFVGYAAISLHAFPYTIGIGAKAEEIRSLAGWYASQGYQMKFPEEMGKLVDGPAYTHKTGSINMTKKIL